MKEKSVKVENRLGIHARPAALLVQVASKYECEVFFENNGIEVNGKSIMGVMMLAAVEGSDIIIRVDGDDEDIALDAIEDLFKRKFDEE